MKDILSLKAEEFAGISFDCTCGRKHSVDINRIVIGDNVIGAVKDAISGYKGKKLFLLADNNTFKVYGSKVREMMEKEGFNFKTFIFDTPHDLLPEEKTLGRLLVEIEKDTDLIVTVGSGVLNDSTRIVGYKMGIPYIIVGTAPSMDGYASVVSPLIIDMKKATFPAMYPKAIIAEREVLKNAPMIMLQAGFGDVLGKYTALADWALSRDITGEYYCAEIAKLVENALKKCVDNVDKLQSRDTEAVTSVMEGLVLAGIAIGLAGTSRPASGLEHHLAHFYELELLKETGLHPLHGTCVGIGTVISSFIYETMGEKNPAKVKVPACAEIVGLLKRSGAPASPAEFGISKKMFLESIEHAVGMRHNKYTIIHYLYDNGLLKDMTEKLVRRFYE